jgi:geranylgeranyl diphosphate synthase type II
MIEYKTAVLVAAAMKMGAIVAEASVENAELIYEFGLNLGWLFNCRTIILMLLAIQKTLESE